ncbi:alpha/beta hydrolase [Paraurantiacibacter namhicola]|uniref:Alpha/beta hydrolase family protein n=1 Tax=Paraurantiacibacter namhicola TaxID=645517 RepID=A0A1C7D5T1_9SPHN|nr:alpha/beta fold hydrolase [Paraurantiacibacter namhicola]ANU06846.1 Alpha/beta hydrolase family protein [Paraurantiacibacter namhicola]
MTWLLTFLAVFYLAALVLVWSLQERFIYPAPPEQAGVPAGFERITYTAADGVEIGAGYRPAREGMPTLLFFHGNGSSWQSTAYVTDRLAALGYGVLAASYRGYAGNAGSPSEKGLYADGRAAYAFLRERGVAPQDIVLTGNSIGSGVATHLATEVEARALVLISPFDSLEETASRAMRWLPVRTLIRDRYDNVGKLPGIEIPVLILHGEEDTLIRLEQARTLAAARPGTKLVTYPGWGHDLVVHPAVQGEIAANLIDQ